MSFLVRGIEMPKNCEECDLSKTRHSSLGDIIDCKYIGTVGSAFKDPYNILNDRHPKCPLVEIPTPHGRLIDVDALNTYDVSPIYGFCVIGVTEEDIGLAETIIEAEGSKE